MTTQDKLATANFQLMKADIHIQTMTTEADQLRAEVARLTAGSEAMQEDARNNTATIKMLMAQLAEVNEENRGLRQMLHMEPR